MMSRYILMAYSSHGIHIVHLWIDIRAGVFIISTDHLYIVEIYLSNAI